MERLGRALGVMLILPALSVGASPAQVVTCTLLGDEEGGYAGTCRDGTAERAVALTLTRENEIFPWTGTVQGAQGTTTVYLAPPSEAFYRRGAIRIAPWLFSSLDSYELAGGGLSYSFDPSARVPPIDLDQQLTRRAIEIIQSAGWTNEESAGCPRPGQSVGLWCALEQASTEVAGYVHSGQPAIAMATSTAFELAAGRTGIRSLQDYNNHPDNTVGEVIGVLERVSPWLAAGFNVEPVGPLAQEEDASAAVTLGDVDGDGDLDALIANGRHWPSQNELFINNGSGGFKVERSLGEERSASYRIQLTDLDGDGDLDAAVANDRSPNRLFLNRGDGWFDSGGHFGKPNGPTRDLEVGDLNGDGFTDLFVLDRDEPSEICFNDGKAGFDRCTAFPGQPSAIKVALADMNEDGALDAILANQYASQNYVYLNDGLGSFPERWPFGTGSDETLTVAVGDLDGDGHLDIVTGNTNQPGAVYYGNGAGGFEAVSLPGQGQWTYRVTIGDMNLDGRPDLLFANAWSANGLYVNLGERAGFDELKFGSPNDGTYGLAVGDVNGDGVPDLIEANDGTQNRLFLGRKYR